MGLLQSHQEASIDAVDRIMQSAAFTKYIKNTFIDNDKVSGLRPILNATIFNLSFWQLVFSNLRNIWQLRDTYKDLITRDDLQRRVLGLQSFKEIQDSLLSRLSADQQKNLQNAIIAISKIPSDDKTKLIDGKFISEVITLINKKSNLGIFQEILDIFLAMENRDSISTYEMLTIIEKVKEIEGIENLISEKKQGISIEAANFLSKNVKGLIDPKKIENALSNLVTQDEIKTVLEIAHAGLNEDIMQLISIATGMLGDTQKNGGGTESKYGDLINLLKDQDLLQSLCFEIKEQKASGEIVYKLSSIGNMLIMMDKDAKPLEKNIEITINPRPQNLMVAKDTFNNEVLKIFNVGLLEIVKDALDIVLNQNILAALKNITKPEAPSKEDSQKRNPVALSEEDSKLHAEPIDLKSRLNGVHSDAIFVLSQSLNEGNEYLNENDVGNLIPSFLTISKDIAKDLMSGKDQISSAELKSLLNDLASRQKGIEDAVKTQRIGSGIAAAFLALMKESNKEPSIKPDVLISLQTLQVKKEQINSDELKELLNDKVAHQEDLEIITSKLMQNKDAMSIKDVINEVKKIQIEEDLNKRTPQLLRATINKLLNSCKQKSHISRDELQNFLKDKFKQEDLNVITCKLMGNQDAMSIQDVISTVVMIDKNPHVQPISPVIIKRLLEDLYEKNNLFESIENYILRKGSGEGIADLIIAASKEVFCNDQYSADEKKLLTEKVIPSIINQIIPDIRYNNIIKLILDKLRKEPETTQTLLSNQQIKAILVAILQPNISGALYNYAKNLKLNSIIGGLNGLIHLPVNSIVMEYCRPSVNNDQMIVQQFKRDLSIARGEIAENEKVNVKAILDKNLVAFGVYPLAGKDLSKVDLSNATFEGIVFEKTTLDDVNLKNSEFYNCSFNNCIITQDIQLDGAKFDIDSLQTFIDRAESQKLDINALLKDVVLDSSVIKDPVDARLIYGLIQYSKATGMQFSQALIVEAHKNNIKYENLQYLAGKGSRLIKQALGEDFPSKLMIMKQLPKKLEDIGISESVLKDFAVQIRTGDFKLNDNASALKSLQMQCVQNILSGHYAKDQEFLKGLLSMLNAEQQLILEHIIHPINHIIYSKDKVRIQGANEMLNKINDVSVIDVKTFNIVCAFAKNDLKLNGAQQNDLISFFKVQNGLVDDQKLSDFINILKSAEYENIQNIVSKLTTDDAQKIELYDELSNSGKSKEYDMIMGKFPATDNLKALQNHSMSEMLQQWYCNRAAGKMRPEAARGGNNHTVDCLEKATEYSSQLENELANDIAKKIILKLFGKGYLAIPDRLDDAEKIYNATLELVNVLDLEYQKILGNSTVLDKLVGDKNTGLCGLLYQQATLFPLMPSSNVYLNNSFTSEGIKDLLKDKLSNKSILIENIIIMQPSLEKHKSELENLDLDVLKVINKNHELFAERSAIKEASGLLYSGNKKLHDAMYNLDAQTLKTVLETEIETFGAVETYFETFGGDLKTMIGNLDISQDLVKLSKELVERNCVGDCFNLVIKNERLKALIKYDIARPMLANILAYESQKPLNDQKDFSTILSTGHTKEFAYKAREEADTIAANIFQALQINDKTWGSKEKLIQSQNNFKDTLAARIFASGKTLKDQNNFKDILAAGSFAGGKTLKNQPNGAVIKITWAGYEITKAFSKALAGKLYGWKEVPKFNVNLIKECDELIKGPSRQISLHNNIQLLH